MINFVSIMHTFILFSVVLVGVSHGFRPKLLRIPQVKRQPILVSSGGENEVDTELSPMQMKIAALKAEAARFRAEASEMEQIQAKERAEKLEQIFQSFDTNKDGEISVEELRQGLNTMFKDLALTDERAEKLLKAFDDSGDGALQLEEFTTIDAFRMKLDDLIREEKEAVLVSQREATEARQAADLAEEKVKALEELLNDSPPTLSDRVVSLIPYLFPLVDSIQFGQYMLNKEIDTPLVGFVTTVYAIYQAVPFSGLFAFFALNFLSGNMALNRLVRFNMQQAILVDIALIIPGLLGGLATYILPNVWGIPIQPEMVVQASTLTFLLTSAVILYSCASSLAGQVPDKIPIISERVEKRVPTADMFNEKGEFVGRDGKAAKGEGEEEEK